MEISKAKDSRTVLTNQTTCMDDEAFVDLRQALEDALAFERGERRELVITRIQKPRSSIVRSRVKNSTITRRS